MRPNRQSAPMRPPSVPKHDHAHVSRHPSQTPDERSHMTTWRPAHFSHHRHNSSVLVRAARKLLQKQTNEVVAKYIKINLTS